MNYRSEGVKVHQNNDDRDKARITNIGRLTNEIEHRQKERLNNVR